LRKRVRRSRGKPQNVALARGQSIIAQSGFPRGGLPPRTDWLSADFGHGLNGRTDYRSLRGGLSATRALFPDGGRAARRPESRAETRVPRLSVSFASLDGTAPACGAAGDSSLCSLCSQSGTTDGSSFHQLVREYLPGRASAAPDTTDHPRLPVVQS
jgi:hypothetical protein